MSVTVEFFAGLYNKHSCYADRLTQEQLDAIHVTTGLEESVRKWILAKKDVILVGNPGDGKTHIIRRVEDSIKRTKAEVVLDATAERDYSRLVTKWKAASKSGRPFILAINQGPLNQLLSTGANKFEPLDEVSQQLRSLLYYDTAPREPKKAIVVDLNLRSILTPAIIQSSLSNLLNAEVLDACPGCFADPTHDAALNRAALMSPRVQSRIVDLLRLSSYTGRHISMRDLQGFLSYVLFGGRTIGEMLRNPSESGCRYYNLCFEGDGELFEAIREVFQPERATLPEVDEHLWENTGVNNGWLNNRPPFTPDHLPDAMELFTAIKRQYFYEHVDGGKLLGLGRDDNSAFFDVLQGGVSAAERHLPRVLKALNIFFCPVKDEDGMSLRLWGAQQYDGNAPRVIASCYQVPKEKFDLKVPQLVPWLKAAMDYVPDHLLLRYRSKGQTIGLRIDRGLWRALALAQRGLPIALRSPQYSKSIQTFITRLARLEATPQAIENVFVYNLALGRLTRVTVDRHNGVYSQ